MIKMTEGTVDMLKRELDHQLRRSELIASNVANIDTPGYKARDMEFAHALQQAGNGLTLKTSDPRHIAEGGSSAVAPSRESSEPGRADGNNVDIDSEMMKLSQNNIQYNIAVQFVSKKLAGIRNVISEMRR